MTNYLVLVIREFCHARTIQYADETGIDRMYVCRLERQEADWLHRPLEGGVQKQPSRDLIIRLGFALRLESDDADDLLMLAGYARTFSPRR